MFFFKEPVLTAHLPIGDTCTTSISSYSLTQDFVCSTYHLALQCYALLTSCQYDTVVNNYKIF